ncbi:MAG: CHAT domain-containing protein [Chlamydiales bacterium]|jgi:CHAT domain-containing protein
MTDDGALSGLTDELLAAPEEAACWQEFGELDDATRRSVVLELKARVDKLVRSDPAAALPVSEALLRAGRLVEGQHVLALRGRAVALHSNGDKSAALACYREAERRSLVDGDELETARIRRSMVDVLHMSGDSEAALECADKARRTFAALGEERLLAQLELNVGNVFFRLEQYGWARSHYAEARRLFDQKGDQVGLAFSDFNLGNLETNAYEFESAERAFRSARAILEAEGMAVVVADCDYSLAYLEFRQGRFAAAIQGLEAARDLYTVHEKPSGAPSCDLDLAEIYVQIDLRRDALMHADRAAEAFEALDLDYETARARVLSAVAHYRLGEHEDAQRDLDRAGRVASRLGNQTLRAFIDVQRFGMQATGGEAAGLPRLRDAWSTLAAAGHRFVADVASVVLAQGLIASGESTEAVELLSRLTEEIQGSTALQRTLGPEIYRTLADAYLELGIPDAAIDALRSATEAIDAAYAQVPGADGRIAFFRRPHEVFVELARLLAAGGDGNATEALALLERSRSRSAALGTPWLVEDDAAISQARDRLDSLLSIRLDTELGTADTSRQESAPSDQALAEAERHLLRACRRRAVDPGVNPLPFDPSSLREAVQEGEVLLAYMLSPNGSCIFLAHNGEVHAVPLDIDLEQLRILSDRLAFQVQKFRLGDRYVRRHAARLLSSSHEVLGALGEILLAPVRSHLGNAALVIVPYGPLHNLPFHALRVDGRSLVETNEVSYAPSIGALVRARAARPPAMHFLATGAAEQTAPGIEAELTGLLGLFGARSQRLDPGTLRERLTREPHDRGVLHIAAHGSFRPGHPVFSGVRLGESFLTVHDIRQMRLELDLVTLSGCETGRKVSVAGEELFSPDLALLTAGARCVVSSLWVLRDDDSARIMHAFYERMLAGDTVRTAVARVQRASLEAHPHPWAWAPFIVVGDPLTRIVGHDEG